MLPLESELRGKLEHLPYSPEAAHLIAQQITENRQLAEQNLSGAKYAAFYSLTSQAMDLAPPELIIGSPFGHAEDYGSGIFEGGSAMVNERTGIPNIVLHEQRLDRLFNRSLPARGYAPRVSREQFGQAMLTTVAVHGLEIFRNPDTDGRGPWVRAYIRPSVHPKPLSGYGVSLRPNYPIEAVVITFTWPDYLDPKMYTDGGIAAIFGYQRAQPITGKHASNYGPSSIEGKEARELGADELVYLAPYLVDSDGSRFWADPNDLDLKFQRGTLADGPGEEVFAIKKDMRTFVYPPMRVNRLGGTVLDYVVRFMAPRLGLETQEADVTLADLREGKYAAVGMIGNAVRIAPIAELRFFREKTHVDSLELFNKGNIPEPMIRLRDRWNDEITGRIDASHASLLTPVDAEAGLRMREALDLRYYHQPPLPLGI